MAESFNIYLDESCHLENDGIPVMTQGAVWCPQEKARDISTRVRDIKKHHRLKPGSEIKWGKLSPASLLCYLAVVDYFLDDDDLHFRGVVIPDKRRLDRGQFGQSQGDWNYSMCFTLLEPIIDPTQHYSIYLDIKDTRSESKRRTLERGLREEKLDGSGNIVRRIQQIRSHESEIMQIADILICIEITNCLAMRILFGIAFKCFTIARMKSLRLASPMLHGSCSTNGCC